MKQALVKGQVSFAFSEGKCFCNLDVTWVGIRGVEEVFLCGFLVQVFPSYLEAYAKGQILGEASDLHPLPLVPTSHLNWYLLH